jgi:UDPglucose 6-dehydrogenase/GDP-mannose 6-dehydrogenase
MKISVVGTGYVGLVSGVCLAEMGHQVTCVDIDDSKVARINRGESPIHEDGLEALLKENVGRKLSATTDLADAVANSELTMIAVGTPFDGTSIDTSYIERASTSIAEALRDKDSFHTVVVKSTVVPGTTDNVVLPILEQVSGKSLHSDFGVSMNPEFLREGCAIEDFMNPDRIVYGGSDEKTLEKLDELYGVFNGAAIIRTTNKTAEMIKYTANALLATLISFSNEIGNLCASLGEIDVVDVMKGVHLDRRLSPVLEDGERIVPSITTYLEAGCGFGGSCFPKDVNALIAHGNAAGEEMSILKSVVDLNLKQPLLLVDRLFNHFDSLHQEKITVLGLAFKPGTDDMRESPAIAVIKALHEHGAKITAYDPIAMNSARDALSGVPVKYVDNVREAVNGASAVVVVTQWDEFGELPSIFDGHERSPVLIDGRRMFDKTTVPYYEGVGLASTGTRRKADSS